MAIRETIARTEKTHALLLLGIAAGHKHGQAREALLDPAVVNVGGDHHVDVRLVNLDRALLERKRFFFDRFVVRRKLRSGQVRRPLGIEQCAAEFRVYLGHVERGGRRHIAHFVREQPLELL